MVFLNDTTSYLLRDRLTIFSKLIFPKAYEKTISGRTKEQRDFVFQVFFSENQLIEKSVSHESATSHTHVVGGEHV